MKVALVSEHASPLATLGGVDAGGQNVHVAALACALAKLGHNVTVYTRRADQNVPRRIAMSPGVTVEHVEAGPPRTIPKDAIYQHLPAFSACLERAWRRDRPDVAHSHFWMSAIATLTGARRLGIPVVHTYHALGVEKRRHQGAADTSPGERIAEEARIAREADRIIVTASAEAFELVRMGANAQDLALVPCGVDTNQFTPDGRRNIRHPNRMRVVALSRLVPRKGIDTVIRAVASIEDVELVIAGGGESADLVGDSEPQRLTELAVALHAADRVFLRGRIERGDVPALLRPADVVACTPWYEPFGIVPLEAMACGVPVIVSAVGGLVDTVVDGITGYHVPPRDARRVADAILALRNPGLRDAMGRAGVERVRARYTWSRVAADTADVYRAVIGESAGMASLATGA